MEECHRGFPVVGPRTHSREAFGRIWKVSQSEILLSLATGPRDAGHDPVDLVHGGGPREQGFA